MESNKDLRWQNQGFRQIPAYLRCSFEFR